MVGDTKKIPAHLRPFANISVVAGQDCIWQGRWDEPGWATDGASQDGEWFNLSGMGAGACLQDDAQDWTYTTQTATQILTDQIVTQRSAYIPLSQDLSQMLPDSPTSQFTRTYSLATIEQICNDLILGIVSPNNGKGDYSWGVWNHATAKDLAGFPTWQLYMAQRDTATCSWMAWESDIQARDIRPSLEYSYNGVTVKYKDSTSGTVTNTTKLDSRLNIDKSQGTAPFPFRRLPKDLSTLRLSSTQADALADALLAQYKDGGYKISLTLTGVRDALGNPKELFRVRAGQNIFLPTVSLSQPIIPTGMAPNVNMFWITDVTYREQQGQAPQLSISCSSFTDTAAFQIARLQYDQEVAGVAA